MGDGSGDLQKIWHEFVGNLVHNRSILDVGAGRGLSKSRLAKNGNVVTTQDINRAYMTCVDTIVPIEELEGTWDIVTSFDVMEHVYDPDGFIAKLFKLSRIGVFVTTPNWYVSPKEWHYTPLVFVGMVLPVTAKQRWFLRYKREHMDKIVEVESLKFCLSQKSLALGVLCTIE